MCLLLEKRCTITSLANKLLLWEPTYDVIGTKVLVHRVSVEVLEEGVVHGIRELAYLDGAAAKGLNHFNPLSTDGHYSGQIEFFLQNW